MQQPTLADLLHTPLRQLGYQVEQVTIAVGSWALPAALERLAAHDRDAACELAAALHGCDGNTARADLDHDRALALLGAVTAAQHAAPGEHQPGFRELALVHDAIHSVLRRADVAISAAALASTGSHLGMH